MNNFGDSPSTEPGRKPPLEVADGLPIRTNSGPADRARFEQDWLRAVPAIHQMLARYRCQPCDRDDVVQETVIRLISAGFSYADPADLRRYAVRIAKNLYIDGIRRQQLIPVELSQLSDMAGPDLAATVEQRFALQAVGRGWAALSAADKALLETDCPTSDRTLANRQKVQRHRLRGRLRRLTLGLIAAVAALAAVPAGHAAVAVRTQQRIPPPWHATASTGGRSSKW